MRRRVFPWSPQSCAVANRLNYSCQLPVRYPSQARSWKCCPSILPNSCQKCGRAATRASESSNYFWKCIWIILLSGIYDIAEEASEYKRSPSKPMVSYHGRHQIADFGHLQDDQRPLCQLNENPCHDMKTCVRQVQPRQDRATPQFS